MYNALVESIRDGEPLNECARLARTTLTAIAGRMSTYTGRVVKYDWALNKSKLDLRPKKYELGPLPVRPVSMPATTELV